MLLGVKPSLLSSPVSCLTELARLLMLLFIPCEYWSCPPYICPAAAELDESIVLERLSMFDSADRDCGSPPDSSLPNVERLEEFEPNGVCGSGFARLCFRLGFLAGAGLDVGDEDLRPSNDD